MGKYMFDFSSDVPWDLTRQNASYLKQAPIAQVKDLIERIEYDLFEMNKNLDKSMLASSLERLESTLRFAAKQYSDKLFEEKDSSEAFVMVLVQHYMWRDMRIITTSNDQLSREHIFTYLLAFANALAKYYEDTWDVSVADDVKLDWYDQYHHQLYILFNAYMMFRENGLRKKITSEKAKENAQKRHIKSNMAKEEFLKLSTLKRNMKNYKSTKQLNMDLQPLLEEIAKKTGWIYSDKFQLERTSYNWLLNNKEDKN
jgi:hypothetical protein